MIRSDTVQRRQRPVEHMIGPSEAPAFFYRNERVRLFDNTDEALVSRWVHAYFTETIFSQIEAHGAEAYLLLDLQYALCKHSCIFFGCAQDKCGQPCGCLFPYAR